MFGLRFACRFTHLSIPLILLAAPDKLFIFTRLSVRDSVLARVLGMNPSGGQAGATESAQDTT